MENYDFDLAQIIKKTKYWCANIFETGLVNSVHILYTIIKDEANIVYNALWEMGVDVELLSEELRKIATTKKYPLKNKNTYASKSLEKILAYAFKHKKTGDKKLNLVDMMVAILEVQNECTRILKNHEITKKDFLEVYNSYMSYENDLTLMGGEEQYSTSIEHANNEDRLPMPLYIASKKNDDILNNYCRNLSLLARENNISNVYGRDREIHKCLEVLNKNEKKNILLIGEAGVGKTSIVEALAEKIKGKDIYELNLNKIVAGTKFRGDLENRISNLLNYFLNNQNAILFVDEAHSLKSAGASDDGVSFLNVLKPPMARGELQLILATTNKDYALYLESDKALARRCTIIQVSEPDKDITLYILKKFAEKYGFVISTGLLNNIYDFAQNHVLNKAMPDKAIDILDMCHAKAKLACQHNISLQIEDNPETIDCCNKSNLLQDDSQISIMASETEVGTIERKKGIEVTGEILSAVLAETQGFNKKPEFSPENFKSDLLWFKDRITGQDDVLANLVKLYYGHMLKKKDAPFNFFFMGNSGMGKTRTAEYFAEKYYGSNIFIINCSEYKEGYSISKLIGSAPGYIRSEEGGLLVNHVDKNPHSVILFDEIEEAHSDIYSILLQVLDRGILTDSKNLKANFLHCAIFFTSNIGIKESSSSIGFKKGRSLNKSFLESILFKKFEKKFLNRIANIAYFNNLTKQSYESLFEKRVIEIKQNFSKKINIRISKNIKNAIIGECVKEDLGARHLNRLIDERIYGAIIMKAVEGSTVISI